MSFRHRMRFGAELRSADDGGGVDFRLWAPGRERIALECLAADGGVLRSRSMTRDGEGWHRCHDAESGAGTLYRYRLDDTLAVPDPASRFNPQDVHGPSEVIDPLAHRWQTADWRGRPWHTAVIGELHVGSFTPQGTFAAAAARLPQWQALGINTIELMPVADFPGTRNWGYDGVLPFAPDAAYGRPEDLKAFVDAAHGLGMQVLLDVVYNHFGPDGNYLHAYCEDFFDARRLTPWGPSIRVEGPCSGTVRRFFIDNALFWIQEYRLDGLRLDAVQMIEDRSPCHLVEDIALALREGPGREREVHLVLENERNAARWLARDVAGRPQLATAQWNDDFHHPAHVLATGEVDGYYRDFAADPSRDLARALAEGFVYQGQPSEVAGGILRGEPSGALPSTCFISFLQTHDQIGNRALGQRLDALAPRAQVEALLSCLLLSPHVPMLFMGEEFAASSPFLYFCDFHGELGRAVSEGRRQEFGSFTSFVDPSLHTAIPDPNDPATFAASVLRWEECTQPAGQRRLALVSRLLGLRHAHLVPLLAGQPRGGEVLAWGPRWFAVAWPLGEGATWTMQANLGETTIERPLGAPAQTVLAHAGARVEGGQLWLPPGAVWVSCRAGGCR